MDIEHLINQGASLSFKVAAADLNEFAHTLIRRTREELEHEIEQRKKEVYYTQQEVENLLSVNNSTLWRWGKRGYLSPVKIGGKNRYRKSDIDRILDQGKPSRR